MADKGRPAQHYRILDRTGAVVAEGTVNECAEQMERNAEFIRRLVKFEHSYPEYWAFPIADKLIQSWDDLVTPLREAYGVPRYDPHKEERR